MIVPREHETPDNKAPLIRAIAALMMCIAILSAITRLVTRAITMRKLKLDDSLVLAAVAVCIAQSSTVIAQGSLGMGKREGLDEDRIYSILKAQYASDSLYIITLLLAKISATRTIWDMAPRERKPYIIATEVLIGLWGASSVIASFFECDLPDAWNYLDGQCFDRFAFWAYVDGLNIVTDLAITAIVLDMFIRLKTSVAKKVLVIGVFGCRVFIIPPIVCHIIFFQQSADSGNPAFDMWKPTVINQVIQCLSIMSTCIPYLKPFLDSLDSGQMAAGDLRGTKSRSGNRSAAYGYASNSRSRNPNASSTNRGISSVADMASDASHRRQKYEKMGADRSQDKEQQKGNITAVVTSNRELGGSWDGQSHTSQTVLVHQTWQVDVERKPTPTGEAL